MWPPVYFGIPNRSIRGSFRTLSANIRTNTLFCNNSITNMGLRVRSINDTLELASSTKGQVPSWSTTETPFTSEEEDAIVTLVVVVIGIIVAIAVLFSMGIFIDCKHQKKDALIKRKLKLRMPPISRIKRSQKDDVKSLASDMCPNGASDSGFRTRDVIV